MMQTAVIFILVSTILPILHSIIKFFKGNDITIFDIGLLSVFLYLLFIPSYYYLSGNHYAESLIMSRSGLDALLIGLLYTYLFYFIDCIFIHSKGFNTSLFNISHQFRKFHDNFVYIKYKHALILFIFVTLHLMAVVFIENKDGRDLTDTNVENIFTKESTIQERINDKLKTIYGVFFIPTLIGCISIVKSSKNQKLRNVVKILSLMICLCCVLGSRTDMVATLVFAFLFLYSINRRKLKIVDAFKVICIMALIFGFFFPVYQVFRLAREYQLSFNSDVSLVSVIQETINNIDRLGALADSQSQTSARSLNVYQAITICLSNETYGGWVLENSLTNILPGFQKLGSNVEYVLAAKYAHSGADIADSNLLYGLADFGFWGIFTSSIYYIIPMFLYSRFCRMFKNYNYYGFISLYLLSLMFWQMFNMECAPYWQVKNILYVVLIGLIGNAIIFRLFNNGKIIKI